MSHVFSDAQAANLAGSDTSEEISVSNAFYAVGVDTYRVTGVRIYIPAGHTPQSNGSIGYLWDATGNTPHSIVATKAFSTMAAGQWNEVLFDTPVQLLHGQYYFAQVYLPAAGYGVWAGALGSFLQAEGGEPVYSAGSAETDPANGSYHLGAPGAPDTNFAPSWYGVDLIFDDGTGPVGPDQDDSADVGDTIQVTRTGLPETIAAHAVVTDPLGRATSIDADIPVGSDAGTRTVRAYLLRDRIRWGSVATSASGPKFNQDGLGQFSTGIPFWVIRLCKLVGTRFYKPPLLAGDVVIRVWSPTVDLLHEQTITVAADEGGWREVEFTTQIDLDESPDVISASNQPVRTSLKRYMVSVFAPNGWYPYTDAVWQVFNWSSYPMRIESYGDRPGLGRSGGSMYRAGSGLAAPTIYSDRNFYIDPIVEWDEDYPGYEEKGGTRYYEQWKNGPRDDRFPLAVFFSDPPFLEDYASVGVNTLVAGDSTPDYTSAIKDAGMHHIPYVGLDAQEPTMRAMAEDPDYAELVKAYYLLDEPDNYSPFTLPEEGLTWKQKLRKLDSTRPIIVGFGRIVGMNNTYYHQPQGATMDYGNKLWRGWADLVDIVAGDFYTLADDQGRQEGWGPWTYGPWIRRLSGLNNGRTPVWGVQETTSQTPEQPVPNEVYSAMWGMLIAGAKAIVLFDHRFPSGLVTKDFAAMLHDTPMRAMITAFAPVLQTLRFALFAPEAGLVTSVVTDDTISEETGEIGGIGIGALIPMAYTTRVPAGSKSYLFAMTDRPGRPNATFTIPAAASKTITVIGESRTINANSSGVFTDDFTSRDYEVHLYSWDT